VGVLADKGQKVHGWVRLVLQLCLCSAVCLATVPLAEEKCGTEIKILLLPAELHSALQSFNAGPGVIGSVYLFDTNALDLLSQGVILRLRTGVISDITVKLRARANLQGSSGPSGVDHYKCEVDLTGEAALRSYSIQTKFAGTLPTTGDELFELLSATQKRLLERAHVSIDWARVKRIPEIKSTHWQIRPQQHFPKLALELWEWRTGEILELSTRVAGDARASAYGKLRQVVESNGLSLNKEQKSKTTLALEDLRLHAGGTMGSSSFALKELCESK
jgi:hypothetical protein